MRDARVGNRHRATSLGTHPRAPLGVVVRRQVPLLGRFIADFYAPSQRLVIEVDGAYHAGRERADARRDAALECAGYRVLRIEASLIVSDVEAALALIRAALLA